MYLDCDKQDDVYDDQVNSGQTRLHLKHLLLSHDYDSFTP